MDSIYLLIPIALILTAIAIKAFFWAVNNHQYDDLDTPASSILLDDDEQIVRPDSKKCKESDNKEGSRDVL